MTFVVRSPVDHRVYRPGVEAPQGVELTGTNRPKTTLTTLTSNEEQTSKQETNLTDTRYRYTNIDQPAYWLS